MRRVGKAGIERGVGQIVLGMQKLKAVQEALPQPEATVGDTEFGTPGRRARRMSSPVPCATASASGSRKGRDVYRDYEAKIGGTLPAKIVRVWLIAVSLFQHSEGKCQYADISFLSDKGAVQVL
jgi:Protein of unknown function (DUF3047)